MRAAVLGSPIAHSLSPVIHRAGYAALGLDHDYQAIDMAPEGLRDFVTGLSTCWMGLSLTMPLKETALTVADEISPLSLLTRSINTLLCGETLRAENTDVYGICTAVSERANRAHSRMIVIGSGATARSAIAAASMMGVETVTVAARNPVTRAHCEDLVRDLGMQVSPDDEATLVLTSDTLTVNTVPADAASRVAGRMPSPDGTLLDVVYHPWPSPLATLWLDHSLVPVAGHVMLLHQAVRQFELMTGEHAPVEAMRSALESALAQR